MPKPKAPSFGSHDYWDRRFTTNTAPFDWLSAPEALDPLISTALAANPDPAPHMLHIGCGSSALSQHLKTHVAHSHQVHNVDYSEVVIAAEREREREVQVMAGDVDACTRWDAVDLLNLDSLLEVCERDSYALVVDKSTSDAVSCADDVVCQVPYAVSTVAAGEGVDVQQKLEVHPLHLMAVHLALVAKPGAQWIALSYSAERYSFLDGGSDADTGTCTDTGSATDTASSTGIPDPKLLWTVVARHPIEANEEPSNGVTHKPKVYHWAYILQRTTTPLFLHNNINNPQP